MRRRRNATFDYYYELSVSIDATAKEIKIAYRHLAVKYHPDKNPNDKNAEAKFKRIAEAYAVLSDPNLRSTYDAYEHSKVRVKNPVQRPAQAKQSTPNGPHTGGKVNLGDLHFVSWLKDFTGAAIRKNPFTVYEKRTS